MPPKGGPVLPVSDLEVEIVARTRVFDEAEETGGPSAWAARTGKSFPPFYGV